MKAPPTLGSLRDTWRPQGSDRGEEEQGPPKGPAGAVPEAGGGQSREKEAFQRGGRGHVWVPLRLGQELVGPGDLGQHSPAVWRGQSGCLAAVGRGETGRGESSESRRSGFT